MTTNDKKMMIAVERAAAKARHGQILFGVVLLAFGLLQIVQMTSLVLPKIFVVAAGVSLLLGLLYTVYADACYSKVAKGYTDEYHTLLMKNGEANGFRFLTFALFIMAFFGEDIAKHTSLPGVIFAVLGTGMLIATLYTSYEPKSPAK